MARGLAQAGHQHVAGAGGDGQQRVIAPRAGVAVVECAFLGQSVADIMPLPGPVQRRLTGVAASKGAYAHGEACRLDEDRVDVWCSIARWGAWSGSLTTASLVTPQAERSRSIDW